MMDVRPRSDSRRVKGGKGRKKGEEKGGSGVHQTVLPHPVCSSCPVCLGDRVFQVSETHESSQAGAQTHMVTCMLGFCPLMSALERSGKLCRSRMKAPAPSLCRLLPVPCAQGRVAGRWAKRCSGPDRRSSWATWADELLFALILFCRGEIKVDWELTHYDD